MSTGRPSKAPLYSFDNAITELGLKPSAPFIHNRYLSIADQIAALTHWRNLFPNLPLPCTSKDLRHAETIARMIDEKVGWSAGRTPPSHCLVIVPYLGSTVATFRFLRDRFYAGLITRLDRQPRFGPDDPENEAGICLGPGITAPSYRLRVELIDLEHRTLAEKRRLKSTRQQQIEEEAIRQGKVLLENTALLRAPKPDEIMCRSSAHAGVLAAYAIHWLLAHQLDGYRIPHPILGGYRLTVSDRHPWRNEPPSKEPWQHVPMLIRSAHTECAELIAQPISKVVERASAPMILRAI
jgi:hypothetical protein